VLWLNETGLGLCGRDSSILFAIRSTTTKGLRTLSPLTNTDLIVAPTQRSNGIGTDGGLELLCLALGVEPGV
jgi:hypothetical protein